MPYHIDYDNDNDRDPSSALGKDNHVSSVIGEVSLGNVVRSQGSSVSGVYRGWESAASLSCAAGSLLMQQRLYFLPAPQGQGALRPILVSRRTVGCGNLMFAADRRDGLGVPVWATRLTAPGSAKGGPV